MIKSLPKYIFRGLFSVFLFLYILAFRAWIFHLGILTKGDWDFYLKSTAETLRINYFSLWLSDSSFGRVLIDVAQAPTYVLYGLFSKYLNFPYSINERVIHFIPAIIINPISAWLLLNYYYPNSKLSNLSGVFVYSLNTYFLNLYTGDFTLGTAFAFMPFVIYTFLRYLDEPKLVNAITYFLSASLMIAYEPRAFYVCLLGLIIFYLIRICVTKNFINNLKSDFKKLLLPGIVLILLNFYWVLGLSKIGVISSNEYFNRDLFGNNFWNILYSFTLHHPWWSGSLIISFVNQNIPFYFFVLPLIAFSGLILNSRYRYAGVSFAAVALLGIFLSKQIDLPFPTFYKWLYLHFPGFNAFREASKFYSLVALGYAGLTSCFFNWLLSSTRQYRIRRYIGYTAVIIFSLSLFWNLKPFINNEIGTLVIDRFIPSEYVTLNSFLLKQNDYYRVYWVPKSSRWGVYTNIHSKVDDTDAVQNSWFNIANQIQDYKLMPYQNQLISILKEPYSKTLFDVSSIKYVIVPIEDRANGDNFFMDYGGKNDPAIQSWYVDQLNKIPFLKKINIGTDNIAVFLNTTYKPYIFSYTEINQFNQISNLRQKYNFLNNYEQNEFLFTFNNLDDQVPITKVTNLFENLKYQDVSSGFLSTTSSLRSNNNLIYINKNYQNVIAQIINGNLQIFEENTGIININGLPLSTSKTNNNLLSLPLNSKKIFLSYIGNLVEASTSSLNMGMASSTAEVNVFESSTNIIPNPSFELGSWQKDVGDCNHYDSNPKLSMSLDTKFKSDGTQSLALEAQSHIACVSKTFSITPGNYLFSFDYQSLDAMNARYYISFNDPNKTTISSMVPIRGTEWNNYKKEIEVPAGASTISIFIYSYPLNRKRYITTRYDNFFLSKMHQVASVSIPINQGFIKQPLSLNKDNQISYKDPFYTFYNQIENGSFEVGAWETSVGDCNNYDDNPVIKMSLDSLSKTDGKQSLELSATRHNACTSKGISVQPNNTYLLSFDYQSPNSQTANYYIGFNGFATSSSYSQSIPIIDNKWHTYSSTIQVPKGADQISLVIYANSFDGTTNIINRYDNFKLIKVPNLVDAYYLVSEPSTPPLQQPKSVTFDLINPTKKTVHITGATTGFFLAMSESWHPSWQLEMNNSKVHGFFSQWTPLAHPDKVPDDEHFELDDFLNGWYVDVHQLCEVQHAAGCTKNADGSYNLEMEIEFWPQRWFYVGLVISGTTLITVLGTLGYLVVRDFRRKRRATELATTKDYANDHEDTR